MVWLAREAPDTALCAAVTATAALWWPDEIVGKAATFCRCASSHIFAWIREGKITIHFLI